MTSIGFPAPSVAFPASTSAPIQFGFITPQQLQPTSAPAEQQQQSAAAQEEPVPKLGTHSVSSELVSLPKELEAPEPSLAASLARFEEALRKNMRAEDARAERLDNTLVGALRPAATEQQVTITGTSVSFVPGCLPSLPPLCGIAYSMPIQLALSEQLVATRTTASPNLRVSGVAGGPFPGVPQVNPSDIARMSDMRPSQAQASNNVFGKDFPAPNKFSGSGPSSVRIWVESMSSWFNVKGVSSHLRAQYARFSLEGDAERYFVERTRDQDLSQMSWDTFTEITTTAYDAPEYSMAARAELEQLRQGNRQVLSLHRKMVALLSRICEPISEFDKIYYFKRALGPALAPICVAKHDNSEWSSLSELVSFAAKREALSKDAQGAGVMTKPSGAASLAAAATPAPLKVKSGGIKKTSGSSARPANAHTGDGPSSGRYTVWGTAVEENARRDQAGECRFCGGSHLWGPECPVRQRGKDQLPAIEGGRPPKMPLVMPAEMQSRRRGGRGGGGGGGRSGGRGGRGRHA